MCDRGKRLQRKSEEEKLNVERTKTWGGREGTIGEGEGGKRNEPLLKKIDEECKDRKQVIESLSL